MPIGFIILACGLAFAVYFCDERPVRYFLIFALLLNSAAAVTAMCDGDFAKFQHFEAWMGQDNNYHRD